MAVTLTHTTDVSKPKLTHYTKIHLARVCSTCCAEILAHFKRRIYPSQKKINQGEHNEEVKEKRKQGRRDDPLFGGMNETVSELHCSTDLKGQRSHFHIIRQILTEL